MEGLISKHIGQLTSPQPSARTQSLQRAASSTTRLPRSMIPSRIRWLLLGKNVMGWGVVRRSFLNLLNFHYDRTIHHTWTIPFTHTAYATQVFGFHCRALAYLVRTSCIPWVWPVTSLSLWHHHQSLPRTVWKCHPLQLQHGTMTKWMESCVLIPQLLESRFLILEMQSGFFFLSWVILCCFGRI